MVVERVAASQSWDTPLEMVSLFWCLMKYLFGFFAVLQVQLVECFDVIRGEGDGNEHDVFDSFFGVSLQRHICFWPKPRCRTDLWLPNKAIGINKFQVLHYSLHGCTHFLWIGISTIHNRLVGNSTEFKLITANSIQCLPLAMSELWTVKEHLNAQRRYTVSVCFESMY